VEHQLLSPLSVDSTRELNAKHKQAHDDQVRAEHERALARGENRVLSPTVNGRLHSFAKVEIGIVNAGSHPTVRSATGLIVLAVVCPAKVGVYSVRGAASDA
jgi:hypothetical protein